MVNLPPYFPQFACMLLHLAFWSYRMHFHFLNNALSLSVNCIGHVPFHIAHNNNTLGKCFSVTERIKLEAGKHPPPSLCRPQTQTDPIPNRTDHWDCWCLNVRYTTANLSPVLQHRRVHPAASTARVTVYIHHDALDGDRVGVIGGWLHTHRYLTFCNWMFGGRVVVVGWGRNANTNHDQM